MKPQEHENYLLPRSWFLNTALALPQKEQGFLGEMVDPMAGTRKYQMSIKYVVMPES